MNTKCILVSALATLLVSIAAPARSDQGGAGPKAHVVTAIGSCLIDPFTGEVNATPYEAPSYPNSPTGMIGVSPGGGLTLIGVTAGLPTGVGGFEDSALQVVETVTGKVLTSIPHAGNWFEAAPEGGQIYVPLSDPDGLNARLLTYAIPSGQLIRSVALPSVATALAVSRRGQAVAVGTETGVLVLNARTLSASTSIPTMARVVGIAFGPSDDQLYVSTRPSLSGDRLEAYRGDGTPLWSILTNGLMSDLVVNREGTRLYAARALSHDVLAVNLTLRQIIAAIPVPGIPGGMALTPDGERLVVGVGAGAMLILNPVEREILASVPSCPGRGGMYARGTSFLAPEFSSLPMAVEFYHGGFGHYFLTNNAQEIDILDTNTPLGWTRTGQTFNVFLDPGPQRAAVCRFFTMAFGAKSSHFFAPRGLGCEETFSNPDWLYEGDVFYVSLPKSDGQCDGRGLPVYRLYNNGMGGAPNHRLTPSLETQQSMLGTGWIAEGAGAGVGMCAAP